MEHWGTQGTTDLLSNKELGNTTSQKTTTNRTKRAPERLWRAQGARGPARLKGAHGSPRSSFRPEALGARPGSAPRRASANPGEGKEDGEADGSWGRGMVAVSPHHVPDRPSPAVTVTAVVRGVRPGAPDAAALPVLI